jgi:hypothetical protein
MSTSSRIATWLDYDMLTANGAVILPELVATSAPLPQRPGAEVARELGGRKLLRYLTDAQLGRFRDGTTRQTFVTPTPYTPEEASHWLVLPDPWIPRRHILILDPARIPWIQGAVWVAATNGLQYILPQGFPADAIIVPGAPGARWEVEVQ